MPRMMINTGLNAVAALAHTLAQLREVGRFSIDERLMLNVFAA